MARVLRSATAIIAALTALMTIVVWLSGQSDYAVEAFGFIPARLSGAETPWASAPALLTPLTATFLHSNFLHLATNLLVFVWCGHAVERALGRASMVIIYVIGGYAAAAAQWLGDPHGIVPMIGASGAISAIMAAFALSFGRPRRFTGNARVIYNGVAWSHRAHAQKQPFYLSAGRLWDEAKNLELIARVADKLPWPVLVAGERPRSEDRASGLTLLGKLPRADLRRLMTSASVFLHPARYEPFGLAPLEAALSGAALILGDIASLREVWASSALFVSPDRPQELLEAARALALDHELRGEFRARARRRALFYSTAAMAREYSAAYRELLAETTSNPRERHARRAVVEAS